MKRAAVPRLLIVFAGLLAVGLLSVSLRDIPRNHMIRESAFDENNMGVHGGDNSHLRVGLRATVQAVGLFRFGCKFRRDCLVVFSRLRMKAASPGGRPF